MSETTASPAPTTNQQWMGVHLIADVTGRDRDAVHAALEAVFCDHMGAVCALEMLATTMHSDYDQVSRWVTGDDDDA